MPQADETPHPRAGSPRPELPFVGEVFNGGEHPEEVMAKRFRRLPPEIPL